MTFCLSGSASWFYALLHAWLKAKLKTTMGEVLIIVIIMMVMMSVLVRVNSIISTLCIDVVYFPSLLSLEAPDPVSFFPWA
jgi:hypothetical protein